MATKIKITTTIVSPAIENINAENAMYIIGVIILDLFLFALTLSFLEA